MGGSIQAMELRRLAAPLLAAAVLTCARAQAQPAAVFEFCAIGDMPYDVPADFPGWERLISAINAARPAFTVHVGDFKKGSAPCSDEYFQKVLGYFGTFSGPLIYTPGDNDWTDCHRKAAGGFDPIERLGKLRKLFFATSESLGQRHLTVTRQGPDYPENARWTYGPVTFATIHAVGSNNNLLRDRAAIEEYLARNAADLDWLREAFKAARTGGSKAVVLVMQADPYFEKYAEERSGINDLVEAMEDETVAWGKPVLLVHGDTHVFRVDKPLISRESGRRLVQFTRAEVFAEKDLHAVRIKVDPADPEVFSFRTLLVPANR